MEDYIWCEKYRPRTIADTILPSDLKTTFQTFVDQGQIPNLLLTGTAGVGKTTVAKAMLNEIGADVMVINASKDGNIDTLRTKIQNFASSVSFGGGRKFVILDEADYLNPHSTQPALRNFMEEFSKNCGFILTCNLKDRIIDPLQSRCSIVNFKIKKSDRAKIATQFFKRVRFILDAENVDYDPKSVAKTIELFFPDWRRTINELQRYSATGTIDTGILASVSFDAFTPMIKAMKEKRFSDVRKWISDHDDIDSEYLFRYLYDELPDLLANESSVAEAMMIIGRYQYQEAFVANSAINRAALAAELMATVEWK